MKTITFLKDADQECFDSSLYRTITLSSSSMHGYIGIDLVDRAGGHKESITLTIQEMERIVSFYRKNVKVK
jgi:hypothetical protein